MIFDVNVHLGSWPFSCVEETSAFNLAGMLKNFEIEKALVASPEAALSQDPAFYNRKLFKEVKDFPSLMPLPTANPDLKNWRTILRDSSDVLPFKAVKITPFTHSYSLRERCVYEFFRHLCDNEYILFIQMRFEDERFQNPAFKLTPVGVSEILEIASHFKNLKIVCLSALFREALQLIKGSLNIYADISFIEVLDTIPSLLEHVPAERILFGSHSPFLCAESALLKLNNPALDDSQRNLIASGNAQELLMASEVSLTEQD